jgi:ankyrin repeat protein
MTHKERPADRATFRRIDAAFRLGDLDALRAAVEDPGLIPNGALRPEFGTSLEYAIYHSPVRFIRTLLDLGADPNPEDHAGFPPLIAALSCSRPLPGSAGRPDVLEIVQLLLSRGADPNQRGLNDWTPLHAAVGYGNLEAIGVLVAAGADPRLRTRIDACSSPREDAEAAGLAAFAEVLAAAEARFDLGR